MQTWYFTFGFGQQHEGCYIKITAESSLLARNAMYERFGRKWSMQYDSAEKAGVEQFDLKEIK